jgi:hypothetical protein
MGCRDGAHLDLFSRPSALRIGQDRCFVHRLACCQSHGATCVELQNLVSSDLQRHPAQLGRLAPAPTVQDHRQGQHASNLIPIATSPRKMTQIRPTVLRSNTNRCRHHKPPVACNLSLATTNKKTTALGIPNLSRAQGTARQGVKRAVNRLMADGSRAILGIHAPQCARDLPVICSGD